MEMDEQQARVCKQGKRGIEDPVQSVLIMEMAPDRDATGAISLYETGGLCRRWRWTNNSLPECAAKARGLLENKGRQSSLWRWYLIEMRKKQRPCRKQADWVAVIAA